MGDLNAPNNDSSQDKKKQDTLFGPNIGIVSSGPEWTERKEKPVDELTPEIVKRWIEKSKETNHSTTTLQALVNLKRPTLRLSPLEDSPTDDPDHIDSQHHHGLEFEYDCDAAKCGIYVYVVLSPSHHLADKSLPDGQQTRVPVFETVTEGGFGKILKLEEGAMLELGRFDHRTQSPTPPDRSVVEESSSTSAVNIESPSVSDITPGATAESTPANRQRKRFTNFHFLKRNQDRSVAGPALAVLDAEAQHVATPTDDDKSKEVDESNQGVKVIIKLAALDEEGKPLSSPNEQMTYLHIVRMGSPPVIVEGAEPEEDKRPWVVKVVKREATIYGLSANSTTATHTVPPSAPPALETHTYPPTATSPTPAPQEDEPSSECLVCLSSPREVVLLPCRHLVACRECAINMIEFGAGGAIVHNEPEPAPAPTETRAVAEDGANTNGGTEGNEEGAAGPPPAEQNTPEPPPPVLPTPTRRKRKAKGWFCPVCRQPYTSLLRITTTPPSKDLSDDDQRDSSDIDDHVPPMTATAPPSVNPPTTNSAAPTTPRRTGFLRAFTRSQPQPDVERGGVVAAA
ncbi:hypothetical protein C8Q75DRAFT_792039 [Abortiporus biennis]|nr:hypothetical protein C8Q75DRAFT_792039 [Abortiporus biennis]